MTQAQTCTKSGDSTRRSETEQNQLASGVLSTCFLCAASVTTQSHYLLPREPQGDYRRNVLPLQLAAP